MKVPVRRTPGTQPVAQREGYAQAARGLDLSPITSALGGFAQDLVEERRTLEDFDLDTALLEETNALLRDFDERKRGPEAGSLDFANKVDESYTTRHQQLLEGFRKRGYSEEALGRFGLRLGGLRQNFAESALGVQAEALFAKADSQMTRRAVAASQYVAANPDGFASAASEIEEGWRMLPGLTEAQREAGIERDIATLVEAGGMAIVKANPDFVIEKLDPFGYGAPPAAAPEAKQGAYQVLAGSWQSVAVRVADQLGLDPVEVAAVFSFESGGTFDPNKWGGDGGKYLGLIQFGQAEQAKYGIRPGSTPDEWATAILAFMRDRKFQPGMGIEDFYSTILTGSPGNYDRRDSNGTSVRNAVPRILGDHRENAENWLASARISAPLEEGQGFGVVLERQGNDRATPVGGRVVPHKGADGIPDEPRPSIETFDPGPSNVPQAPDPATLIGAEPAAKVEERRIASVETGHPLLDRMTGAQRMRVVAAAWEEKNRTTVQTRGAMDVVVQNAGAAVGSDTPYEGPMPTKDEFIAAYGGVVGEQKYAEFQGYLNTNQVMQQLKTLTPSQINAKVEGLKPRGNSPTLDTDMAMYQAARQAANTILEQRSKDPAAYILGAYPDIGRLAQNADTPEQRKQLYAQMERAFEQIGVPEGERFYFTDGQLEEIGNRYKAASGPQKLQILHQMFQEMGPKAGRTLAMHGGGQGVADDFFLYSQFGDMPGGMMLLGRVFEGRRIMEKDRARKPNPASLQSAFRGELGPGIRHLDPDVSRALREAAEAVYVENGGSLTSDGALNPDLFRGALRQVLGGTAGKGKTGWYKFPGAIAPTILPPRVNADEFDDWLDSVTTAELIQLAGGKKPRDSRGGVIPHYQLVDEGTFVMVAPGVYSVLLKDGRAVGDGSGRPWKLRLNRRAMGLR